MKMTEQNQKSAITIGIWPLAPGTYDPALDEVGIHEGTAIFGLFDESYKKYYAPESIPGLTKVDSTNELSENTYCVLNASSGFKYVLVMSDIDGLEIKMLEYTIIEERINDCLKDEIKAQALEFVNYLNTNQMQPKIWFDETFWHIPYGEYYLFGIHINPNKWNMNFFMGDYKGELNKDFINIIHEHVQPCVSCHGDNIDICPKGKDMTIFGKEFKNTCIQFTINFENPTDDDFAHIKELIEYYKNVVSYSDSFHAR